jgi:adenylate kinase
MAPIGDDTVQSLQELVNKLESRVKQLEDKLQHASAGTKHIPVEGVRMILMGPPGAGAYFPLWTSVCVTAIGAPANYKL